MFFLANDHAGFRLKENLKKILAEGGIKFVDLGTNSEESVDYPDFGHALAKKVSENLENRGVGICGSGHGIAMALNRHSKIRAARCLSTEDAEWARRHNDANVLVLAGRQTSATEAEKILAKFLETEFEGGRHEARVEKIEIS